MGCCSRTPEELPTVLTAARQKVPRADGEYKRPAGQFEGLGFGMIRRTGFFKKRGAAGQRFQDPEFLQTLRSILEQVRHVKRPVYFFFFNRKSKEKALSPNAQCCKNFAINEILPELADYLDRPTMRGRGRSTPLSSLDIHSAEPETDTCVHDLLDAPCHPVFSDGSGSQFCAPGAVPVLDPASSLTVLVSAQNRDAHGPGVSPG